MTPPPSLPFLSGGIKAEWFDSESSAKYTAAFRIDEFGFAEAASEKGSRRESLSQIKVSPRLGDIPRRIIFSDGVCIVAADNDYIDRALARTVKSKGGGGGIIYKLESNARWILPMLAAAAVAGYFLFRFGVPFLGDALAYRLPDSIAIKIGEHAYRQILEDGFLKPSELPEEDKIRARKIFQSIAAEFKNDNFRYQLRFHKLQWGENNEIANAFALPSGLVIATDELINIAERDSHLLSVFAHEIGHARERHTMRSIARAASAAVVFGLLFGDVSGLAAIPFALAQLKYSRDFERDADCFAYRILISQGESWQNFSEMLKLIEGKNNFGKLFADESGEENQLTKGLLEFLSTHPPSAARADPATHCE